MEKHYERIRNTIDKLGHQTSLTKVLAAQGMVLSNPHLDLVRDLVAQSSGSKVTVRERG